MWSGRAEFASEAWRTFEDGAGAARTTAPTSGRSRRGWAATRDEGESRSPTRDDRTRDGRVPEAVCRGSPAGWVGDFGDEVVFVEGHLESLPMQPPAQRRHEQAGSATDVPGDDPLVEVAPVQPGWVALGDGIQHRGQVQGGTHPHDG